MLYLVTGTIHRWTYGNDDTRSTQETRLVEADNADLAGQKFCDYFDGMTSEYSVYYRTMEATVHETIR